MWNWLDKTILKFAAEFKRDASYQWFVIIVIGLMIRTDTLGITGIIRDLNLNPGAYEIMIHFFHSNAWTIKGITQKWMQIVANSGVTVKEDGFAILIGDGMNQLKEGRRVPGVKKLHQESENSSKSSYIFGHFYGVLGVLTGNKDKMFCTPLAASIQSGVDMIRKWEDPAYEEASHVVKMIQDACSATNFFGTSILLLDRYFLSTRALTALYTLEKKLNKKMLHIVTRAKRNCTAYTKPKPKAGRGRPAKKGTKVKIFDFFENQDTFTEATVPWYGRATAIRYLCKDLLWGKGLYKELRFVLVCCGDSKTILVSTNLAFTPVQIIKLYGYRFKIEVTFKALKQTLKAFFSHFWSKSMPKLNRFSKKGNANPLEDVQDQRMQKNIVASLKAIEGHALFGCIALGLLQMIALMFSKDIDPLQLRWLRTKTNATPSEATIAVYMRKMICFMFQDTPRFHIIAVIQHRKLPFINPGELRSTIN